MRMWLCWALLLVIAISIPIADVHAGCGDSVTIYGLEGCPWCEKAEQFLSDNGVKYERIDMESEDDINAMEERYGARTFPIIVIGEHYNVGFDKAWLAQNLCLDPQ